MRLPRGDYWVCKPQRIVRVERKTYTDLLHSLEDDRLNYQLVGVDELVLMKNEWVPRDVFEHLTSARFLDKINGISEHTVVKFSTDVEDFFHRLRLTERKIENGVYACIRLGVTVNHDAENPAIAMLACLPNISLVRARRIIAVYGSFSEAIDHVGEWHETVEGIGVLTVERVRTAIFSVLKLK